MSGQFLRSRFAEDGGRILLLRYRDLIGSFAPCRDIYLPRDYHTQCVGVGRPRGMKRAGLRKNECERMGGLRIVQAQVKGAWASPSKPKGAWLHALMRRVPPCVKGSIKQARPSTSLFRT